MICFIENKNFAGLLQNSFQPFSTFSVPESPPETTYFIQFFKTLTKNLDKTLVIKFVLMKQINFKIIYFFYMLHLLLLGKTPQPCIAGEKLWL